MTARCLQVNLKIKPTVNALHDNPLHSVTRVFGGISGEIIEIYGKPAEYADYSRCCEEWQWYGHGAQRLAAKRSSVFDTLP